MEHEETRFTPGETLIAALLSQVLKHLAGGDDRELRDQLAALDRALEFDHHADALHAFVEYGDPVPQSVQDEVYKILNLWQVLAWAYDKLPEEHRAKVGERPRFPGYDEHPNQEDDYYKFTNYVVGKPRVYDDLEDPRMHRMVVGPRLDRYRAMMDAFEEVGGRKWPLARKHPSELTEDELAKCAQQLKGILSHAGWPW
ncbi:MAG: YfbU family protein [Gammaproteobacteria bacterium]|nr:YfbU family protein [Gammaproteobacteria bacterium]